MTLYLLVHSTFIYLCARYSNLIENVYKSLEERAAHLEESIEERTMELIEEKKKSNILLNRMLPK